MEALLGRLLGPYQLIERLERERDGGNGVTFRAVDRRLFNRTVAVTLFQAPDGDSEFLPHFERAAETLTELRHPHILPVQDFGEQEGLVYVVTPYLAGESLTTFVGESNALDEVLRVIAALCDALDYAHRRGLVHGALTPATVQLTHLPPGEPTLHDAWPFLTDFGFAEIVDPAHQGLGSATLLPYQPPERGLGSDRGAADFYSLAAILYALLTGAPPPLQRGEGLAEEEPPPAVLPPGVGAVLQRALSPEPAERFTSGAELVLALHEAVGSGRQMTDADAPTLLEEARNAVTAGRFRAAGRLYGNYLRLRPDDELARRELAALEPRLNRLRRIPATSRSPLVTPPPAGPASAAPPAPADAEPDSNATPEDASTASTDGPVRAPDEPAPPAPRRFGGLFRRSSAPPGPTATDTADQPPEPARLPSTYRPPRPAPFKPLVAPAHERQHLILPMVLGALALVLALGTLGSWLLRRDAANSTTTPRASGSAPAAPSLVVPVAPTVAGAATAAETATSAAPSRTPTSNVLATIPLAPTSAPIVPTATPTVPPLPPVLVDDFGNPETGFPRQLPGQEQPPYWNGEYIIQVPQPDGFTIAELAGSDFGDLMVEIDIRAEGPPAGGSYGLVFRRQVTTDAIDQYFVLIDPEAGTVRLVHWFGTERVDLLPATPHPAVARGNEPNHLTVVTKGPQITVYVNGAQIVQVIDPGPQNGILALRADAGAGAPFEARFDNLIVRPVR